LGAPRDGRRVGGRHPPCSHLEEGDHSDLPPLRSGSRRSEAPLAQGQLRWPAKPERLPGRAPLRVRLESDP